MFTKKNKRVILWVQKPDVLDDCNSVPLIRSYEITTLKNQDTWTDFSNLGIKVYLGGWYFDCVANDIYGAMNRKAKNHKLSI